MIIRKSPSILSWLIILASILFCLIPNNAFAATRARDAVAPPSEGNIQTSVRCTPKFWKNGGGGGLSSFGGDVDDNCLSQFYYDTLPGPTTGKPIEAHYVLNLSSIPGLTAQEVDHCDISAFIPNIHASAQNVRYDLFVNNTWLGWKGQTIDQNTSKGWQDLGLSYPILAAGNATIEVVTQDQIDQSGEIAWPAIKFSCLIVPTS